MILVLIVMLSLIDVDGAPTTIRQNNKPKERKGRAIMATNCAPIDLDHLTCSNLVDDIQKMSDNIMSGFTSVSSFNGSKSALASCTLDTFLHDMKTWTFTSYKCEFQQCLENLREKCNVFKSKEACENNNTSAETYFKTPLLKFLTMINNNSLKLKTNFTSLEKWQRIN